ncbi:hypothetical protein D3C85_1411030 [compost metagenome]
MHTLHLPTIDINITMGNFVEASNHVQQRGLATPGRPHKNQKIPPIDLNIDSFENFYFLVVLDDIVDIEKAHNYYPFTDPAIRPRTK